MGRGGETRKEERRQFLPERHGDRERPEGKRIARSLEKKEENDRRRERKERKKPMEKPFKTPLSFSPSSFCLECEEKKRRKELEKEKCVNGSGVASKYLIQTIQFEQSFCNSATKKGGRRTMRKSFSPSLACLGERKTERERWPERERPKS